MKKRRLIVCLCMAVLFFGLILTKLQVQSDDIESKQKVAREVLVEDGKGIEQNMSTLVLTSGDNNESLAPTILFFGTFILIVLVIMLALMKKSMKK